MTLNVSQAEMVSMPIAQNVQQNSDLKEEASLKPNTLKNRLMSNYQKTTSAFTEYPAKGLTGSKKSNFYEFLAMGVVPYLVGSAMFMAIFKSAKKMALGVVFYGLAKGLSKKLISTPVKLATGIDTEMAYERHIYTDPKTNPDHQINEYEQHKVMESHDFPRYDMLYGDKVGKPHNYLYDKIAKKNGLGDNLAASDTEVKPLIKDVISRSNTAKSISSYLWAAVGVALAAQTPWDNFFKSLSKASWNKYKPSQDNLNIIEKAAGKILNTSKNIGRITESFGRNFIKASKSLFKGPDYAKGFTKYAGKGLIGLAALATVFGVANTIYGARHTITKNKNVFDKDGKITVQ